MALDGSYSVIKKSNMGDAEMAESIMKKHSLYSVGTLASPECPLMLSNS